MKEDYVYWAIEMAIAPGKAEAMKALVKEMVPTMEKISPRTRIYEFSFNKSDTVCHIFELFEDSAATMAHLDNFDKHFARRMGEVCKAQRFVVYGRPGDDVRKSLERFSPEYCDRMVGFFR